MVESQSRYGIMEQLNSKKIEAQKRLSSLTIELKQQELAFDNAIHTVESVISNAESNFEANHKNWVTNQEFNLDKKKAQFVVDQKLREQVNDREVEASERQIQEAKDTYQEKHINFVSNKKDEQIKSSDQYDKWKSMKALEQDSIAKEIAGYDDALSDLKEVSKESVKKE